MQTRVGPIATAAAAQGATTAAFAAGMSGTWGWASSRWMRPAENTAPGEQLAEGLEYARLGQTRSLDVRAGVIAARVQGRMPGAYKVEIRLPVFTAEQWERVLGSMAEQPRYGAPLASGELPSNIEDLFAPIGLRLFPVEAPDLATSCTCEVFRGTTGRGGATPWCKHVCCAMFIIAERLGREPLLVFALRGLPEQELLERLRQQRALVGAARTGGAPVPVHAQHVPGVADPQSPWNRPLEETIDEFWGTGERGRLAMESLEVPLEPPAVTHPLLRRLGQSPWAGQAGAKFPLVGLLATCYDVVSGSVLRDASAQDMT
ncbi:MAG: hypothetical protein KF699_15260 [Phycisphaeraceae bacterium]|nr:hypothetical protein [Phycisphaeraceae bacterium]